MTGRMKRLLVLGTVVLGLLGAVLALLLTDEGKNGGDQAVLQEGQTVPLMAVGSSQVKEITVANPDGVYKIAVGKDGAVQVAELKDYMQDASALEGAVRNLTSISGEVVYEDGFDRERYGLADPQASVKLLTEQNETTVYLGDFNESASAWYAALEGDGRLYTIPKEKGDYLLRSMYAYLDTTLIPAYDTAVDRLTERLRAIRIERPDLEEALEIAADEEAGGNYTSSYVLTSPVHVKTSLAAMNHEIGGLLGLKAEEVLGIFREEDRAALGLDDPVMVMTVEHDGAEECFTVGGEAPKGGRYLISSEKKFLYRISEEKLTFLHLTADDLFFELALLPDITKVEEVTLELYGECLRFRLNHAVEQEEDTLQVTAGEQKLDEKLFRTFYSFLLEIDIEKLHTDPPEGSCVMRITYQYTDTDKDVVEAFAMEDPRRMSISVNGEPQFEGRIAYIEKVRTELAHLLAGEAIDTNW